MKVVGNGFVVISGKKYQKSWRKLTIFLVTNFLLKILETKHWFIPIFKMYFSTFHCFPLKRNPTVSKTTNFNLERKNVENFLYISLYNFSHGNLGFRTFIFSLQATLVCSWPSHEKEK